MAVPTLQSQTKKSPSQLQQYGPMIEANVINIKAISTDNDKAELGRSTMPTPLPSTSFQVTPGVPFTVVSNDTPSFREVIIYYIRF